MSQYLETRTSELKFHKKQKIYKDREDEREKVVSLLAVGIYSRNNLGIIGKQLFFV